MFIKKIRQSCPFASLHVYDMREAVAAMSFIQLSSYRLSSNPRRAKRLFVSLELTNLPLEIYKESICGLWVTISHPRMLVDGSPLVWLRIVA